ncbi:MAG: SDR family NAD(P)-dependent oxidoreductase [Flavobacteriales bacterium]|nr:SDR family NAD(P)-dependent oxidoreductase [Flavobacteriales bacterium]
MIVVTGASRGIGRETVRALVAEHRRRVLAVARDAEALGTLRHELGTDRLETLAQDLAAPDAADRLVAHVAGRRLAGLVHNAGLLVRRPLGEWTAQDTAALFHLNAAVPLLLTQALAPLLSGDPPGHVVHIGSMGGFQDSVKFPSLAAYSASKAALACVAQCLAEELKDRGVRSNCLAIGAAGTEMLRAAFPGYDAPVTASAMGAYVARFTVEGHHWYNGKVLPVAVGTP